MIEGCILAQGTFHDLQTRVFRELPPRGLESERQLRELDTSAWRRHSVNISHVAGPVLNNTGHRPGVDKGKVILGISNSSTDIRGLPVNHASYKIYLEATIEGCFRWCSTSYIHSNDFICRRKLLRHVNHPCPVLSREIEDRPRASPQFMDDIPSQKCLERLVSVIYDIRVLSTPPC
jgi:hypothetical protein